MIQIREIPRGTDADIAYDPKRHKAHDPLFQYLPVKQGPDLPLDLLFHQDHLAAVPDHFPQISPAALPRGEYVRKIADVLRAAPFPEIR